jgi:hypothetical protein
VLAFLERGAGQDDLVAIHLADEEGADLAPVTAAVVPGLSGSGGAGRLAEGPSTAPHEGQVR